MCNQYFKKKFQEGYNVIVDCSIMILLQRRHHQWEHYLGSQKIIISKCLRSEWYCSSLWSSCPRNNSRISNSKLRDFF